jgi:glycosylphosphatidylinositol transamidase (GPIT) subunit GPI8
VLHTTYCHYKVYNGRYITLDYNSSGGGYRTDSSRANWNRQKEQMEEFDYSVGKISYPKLEDRWALLVAGSSGWKNYRFQADVLAMYQLLKQRGYDDDHIVLIMEDDVAWSASNPNKGVVQVAIGGANLYTDVVVDYHPSDLNVGAITSILLGERSGYITEVIGSTANDNIFVFWSGHGLKNQLCWGEQDYGLTAKSLRNIFEEMDRRDNFRKQIWFVESCYSGSVLNVCSDIEGIVAFTAADANETSKADIFNSSLGVWMSNQFTYTLRDEITKDSSISLYNLYCKLFINTLGSHVMIFNEDNYGNVITNSMEEYL